MQICDMCGSDFVCLFVCCQSYVCVCKQTKVKQLAKVAKCDSRVCAGHHTAEAGRPIPGQSTVD